MKLSYYPGCTMKSHAANFEESLLFSMRQLGAEIEELDRWNCCGTVISLAQDDVMRQLAPIRNMVRAKEAGASRLMTACAMCYNTLHRANGRVRLEPQVRERMNAFMYDEKISYEGEVDVVHVLQVLREQKDGLKAIAAKVTKPLKGLKAACYYGCMLTRPKTVAFDDIEDPVMIDDVVQALGAKTIDFSHKTECCGAYQTVDKPEIVAGRTYEILNAARDQGAEIIVVSCPLCAFNLDHRQAAVRQHYPDFEGLPVVYFTQLMAIAFGGDESVLKLDLHHTSPRPLLAAKGLL